MSLVSGSTVADVALVPTFSARTQSPEHALDLSALLALNCAYACRCPRSPGRRSDELGRPNMLDLVDL